MLQALHYVHCYSKSCSAVCHRSRIRYIATCHVSHATSMYNAVCDVTHATSTYIAVCDVTHATSTYIAVCDVTHATSTYIAVCDVTHATSTTSCLSPPPSCECYATDFCFPMIILSFINIMYRLYAAPSIATIKSICSHLSADTEKLKYKCMY